MHAVYRGGTVDPGKHVCSSKKYCCQLPYTKNGSKNHRDGFGTLHDSNKVVTAYSTLVGDSGDPFTRCGVLAGLLLQQVSQASTLNGFYAPAAKITSAS